MAMKKILFVLAFIASTSFCFSQSTTPRIGDTKGAAKRHFPTILTQNLTDAILTTDTVLINPKASENWYFINPGDTLKGNVTIALVDTTAAGRSFSDNNCYKGDKLFLVYTTTGLKQDTIQFYGAIQVDSSGSANNKLLNIKKDTNKKSYITEFVFDGVNFIQRTPGNSGNGGSMPTNR